MTIIFVAILLVLLGLFYSVDSFIPEGCEIGTVMESTCKVDDWCKVHPFGTFCDHPYEPPVECPIGTFLFSLPEKPEDFEPEPLPCGVNVPIQPGTYKYRWCCEPCPDTSYFNSFSRECDTCPSCQKINTSKDGCEPDPNCAPPPSSCPSGTAPFKDDGTECLPPPNNKCPAGTKLSGKEWKSAFNTLVNIEDLLDPFKTSVKEFINAMKNAKPPMNVTIISVYRKPQRSYLLNHAYALWKKMEKPETIKAYIDYTQEIASLPNDNDKYKEVKICWIHTNSKGDIDYKTSYNKGREQIESMGVVTKDDPKTGKKELKTRPAFPSKHNRRTAIDMKISWSSESTIIKFKNGTDFIIRSNPKTSMNTDLWKIANSYNIKHYGERPGGTPSNDVDHWSDDGY